MAGSGIAVVETSSGELQGFVHHGIYTYRGVPYAKAARFEPPQKVAHWDGIHTALTYGYISPMPPTQAVDDTGEFLTPHRYGISNDACQNLNVWTPGIHDGKKRPVMVWLHGGAFSNGSSIEQVAYDGENLSRKGDVVVVSVNHRLNVVGFLDLSAYGEKYKYSGNVGILDLVSALEWVKANIASFGGDPDNVTIFGQSGGGGKVITLMATPAAKGLFHKAIVESGAARNLGMTLAEQKNTRRIAELVLKNLEIAPADVDKLQTMPYAELNAAGDKALKQVSEEMGIKGGPGRGIMWSPMVDSDFIPAQPFLNEATAISRDVPMLIGSTLTEFPMADFIPRTRESKNWSMDDFKAYLKETYGDKSDAVAAAYRKAYPDLKYTDWLYVDTIFRPGTIRTAQLKADQKSAPVYMYLFTWQSPVLDGRNRANHCMEIPFVFNNTEIAEQVSGGGPEAYALADKVSQAWINFARTGNPNNSKLPNWPTYTRENGATMLLNTKSEVRNHHDEELMRLLVPDN